ncbi:MAG TPA: hypothetical protein VGI87_12780 [Solirubrobacteraceae bacterium]
MNIFVGTLGALIALLVAAAPALAAPDQTTAAVSCAPSSVATGSATTCTATITDTATTPSSPSGTVTFTPSPSTGAFGVGGNACTLSTASASTASCTVSYSPASGGSYSLSGSYGGDPNHSASTGNDTVSAVDSTTTTLSCTPTTVQISTSTNCTAVLADSHSKQPPIGEIDFTSVPATGSFGTPSSCVWTPDPSGPGGSATCQITFTPTNPGAYTLTAHYAGDDTHSASQGTSKMSATTTPQNGGPGTHGGGSTKSVTIGNASGPPPPGQVTVAPRAKVVHKHANVLLTCVGAKGSSCTGALTLTTKTKVKVRVKTFVKVKVRSHKKGKSKGGAGGTLFKLKPKVVTKRETKTILVGTLSFRLATGSSSTVAVTVSKAAMRLLTRHRGRLRTQALVDGVAVHGVALGGKHHKHHKHRKHKKHKKHGHGHAKKKH